MESESEELERFHFFGFRLLRLRRFWSRENELLVSEAEAEEPTNHKDKNRKCWSAYSYPSASYSDSLAFSELYALKQN